MNKARVAPPARTAYRAAVAVAAAVISTCAGLGVASSAQAAYPGPDGLIVFKAATDNGTQIFTINPDTLARVQLTHLAGDAAATPHWNPDSSMITFEYDPPNGTCQVATMNADGSNLTVLPLAAGDACEASPTFSADGTRLLYEGYNGKRNDAIYSSNLDGTDRRVITHCQGKGVTDPETSPDGRMLAFACGSRAGTALFVSNVDGSRLRQLTPFSFDVGIHQDWSPDSRRIMFGSFHDEGTPQAQANFATINADGTGLQWLTDYPAGGPRAYGNSYSPDGRWIVLRMEQGDQSGPFQSALFKIRTDGSDLTQITAYSSFRPRGMCWGSAS